MFSNKKKQSQEIKKDQRHSSINWALSSKHKNKNEFAKYFYCLFFKFFFASYRAG